MHCSCISRLVKQAISLLASSVAPAPLISPDFAEDYLGLYKQTSTSPKGHGNQHRQRFKLVDRILRFTEEVYHVTFRDCRPEVTTALTSRIEDHSHNRPNLFVVTFTCPKELGDKVRGGETKTRSLNNFKAFNSTVESLWMFSFKVEMFPTVRKA